MAKKTKSSIQSSICRPCAERAGDGDMWVRHYEWLHRVRHRARTTNCGIAVPKNTMRWDSGNDAAKAKGSVVY